MQGAWRRHKKRKLAKELMKQEGLLFEDGQGGDDDHGGAGAAASDSAPLLGEYKDDGGAASSSAEGSDAGNMHLGVTFLASKFAKNTKKGAHQKVVSQQRIDDVSTMNFPKLAKPDEPDFSLHTEDVL